MSRRRCRRWCFTIFEGRPLEPNENTHRCLVYQMELSGTERKHWQGYIEYNQPKSMMTVKKDFNNKTIHLEEAKGTRLQNIKYCTKIETRIDGPYIWPKGIDKIEFNQGTRNDLKDIQEDIKNGKKLEEIADENFGSYIRYERGLKSYMLMKSEPRSKKTHIIIFWGDTGTGKSHYARQLGGDKAYWMGSQQTSKFNKTIWMDGYDGQETVILDDFRWKNWDYAELLKLLDKYPLKVQTKGGFVNFNPKKIIITCPTNPKEWFPKERANEEEYDIPAELKRRIEHIHNLVEKYNPDDEFPVQKNYECNCFDKEDEDWIL